LPSIELIPLARADNFLCVAQCCRLLETMVESFAPRDAHRCQLGSLGGVPYLVGLGCIS
jgi:hypothetical protein